MCIYATLYGQVVSGDKSKIPVIFDTDADNELDDQHALAYLLFSQDKFDIRGITINSTKYQGKGSPVDKHYEEAVRVLKLCGYEAIPVKIGAELGFDQIEVDKTEFDGYQAVDFIHQIAKDQGDLVVIAVGKLTNLALALKKYPGLENRMRVVWLGSNYPQPGEYNLKNDPPALNYILRSNVPFEIVTVRYGQNSGASNVRVTLEDIVINMKNVGPRVVPVTGRHGGLFSNFGDYSINLFKNIHLEGDPPSRALYDVVAIAILKDPGFGEKRLIQAPIYESGRWRERPDQDREITIWENFNPTMILHDFFQTMRNNTSPNVETND